ncbi:hypothetical protein [Nocardioides sp. REDSEA-S30_B4]|uniref:hypothetical protein n=1 Tax=Nocardioides sp. REDSEA-S30_B4 TaxID=1811552 RepID=UPI000AAE30E0|nr:hypothetical protein [Nocardioides sp. REDSEA-S30_B4]
MLVPVRRALRSLVSGLLPVLLLAGAFTVTGTAPAGAAIEDFAHYQPEERCSPKAKPGAAAVDWSNDATTKAGRKRVKAFLKDVLAEDHRERPAAKARRMGIMYIIWNDQMYAAWRGFEPTDYLSSSCKRKKKCSKTLRHRDHVHISLSRQGGFGNTSFYEGRVVKKKK